MNHSRTTVELIKERLPIEEVVGSYVKLDKAGKSLKARCPFHNEKSASFFVSPERGGYYCFGCGAKGDIFSFVEQFEGLDFRGALKVLAEKAGVPLVVDEKSNGDKDQLFAVTEVAAQFFEAEFGKSAEAQEYLKSRGISPETRQSFRIGWAPDGWKHLLKHLKSNGWNEVVMEKAGLVKKQEKVTNPPRGAISERGEDLAQGQGGADNVNYYDRFRGRIIFPISDSSGRIVAFTGRILKDEGKSAKYLNSPDTPIFNKSQILFGLDKAKTEIRRIGYSILVEGQMDLVLSHQVGVKNTVAASGTALTDKSTDESGVTSNLGMVRRLSTNMIIALDSDRAGRAAAMKAVAATALSMGMSVKIADIEGGKDPADLILNDPQAWKDVLKNSKHVIEFELHNVINEFPDRHKLAKAIRERVFPFLARIDSEMDKAFYVKMIAEKGGLAEQAVWEDLKKVSGKWLMVNGKQGLINSPTINQQPTTNNQSHRLGLIERRMFGLLALMDQAGIRAAAEYREQVKSIAGPTYKSRAEKSEAMKNDISFEAEEFFGTDETRWNLHMKELISVFEEDLINEELIATMSLLREAEKRGESENVSKYARICQELSVKRANLAKERHK